MVGRVINAGQLEAVVEVLLVAGCSRSRCRRDEPAADLCLAQVQSSRSERQRSRSALHEAQKLAAGVRSGLPHSWHGGP
jgi:hypothetical protein